MSRFLSAMKTDVTVQLRNRLYVIGIAVAVLVAIPVSLLAKPDQLSAVVPALMLLVIGGTTLLYIAGMIIFDKDEGTLHAVIVSPLRSQEYLGSKVITLTALATLESIVMIGGAMLLMSFDYSVDMPNIPLLLLGIIGIGIIYTLIGIILIVRYDKITEFLIPMAVIAVALQLPFLHFLGLVEHPIFLLAPVSAPTVLMQGAYHPLTTGEWIYAVGYTAILLVGLAWWAYRAFNKHIIAKVG